MSQKITPAPTRLLPALLLLAVLVGSCEEFYGPPPVNLAQYDRIRRGNWLGYPDQTVYAYNLRRVCDADLPVGERVESLQLAVRLGSEDPLTLKVLMDVLNRPDNPKRLQYALLEYVLQKGDPAVAEYAVRVLEDRELPPALRDAVLGWLTQNTRPEVLAQVVKLWAQENSITSLNEPRYRQIVERITGMKWADALLAGINSPGFFARGSALEILTGRLDGASLRRRIERMVPATPAMMALREFVQRFDYLPASKTDFLAATAIYTTRARMLGDTAQRSRQWQKEAGYRFAIRDFHLLSRLASDPLRKDLRRWQLIAELGQAVSKRDHIQRTRQPGMPAGSLTDSFSAQAPNLSMADLWNIYLLNEMLERQRVQLALKTMADCDFADDRSAWGGLVFYENGKAEAKLYPAATRDTKDDLHYLASEYLEADGRDSLCRFHAHFEKVNNAERAGPDAFELVQAKRENYYGLVLTSIDEKRFAAHYYNPEGVVISLGTLPFRGRGS